MPSHIADSVSLQNDLGSMPCCGSGSESAGVPANERIERQERLARAIYLAFRHSNPGALVQVDREGVSILIDGRFNLLELAGCVMDHFS